MRQRSVRTSFALALAFGCTATGCGGTKLLGSAPVVGLESRTPKAAQKLGFPAVATKNTTRVGGGDPIADAAAVALAVYPSAAPGTHPPAIAFAPSSSWQAALASASLMAAPFRVPLLLSGNGEVPSATADAFAALSPSGLKALPSTPTVLRIGGTQIPSRLPRHAVAQIGSRGQDGIALAAAIDRFEAAARGRTSRTVMVASADAPAYAIPAAGLAAESGQPILYVTSKEIPAATETALRAHAHPRIYVVGPPSAVPDTVLVALKKFGRVRRVGTEGAAANSIAFATYRDPPCTAGQACAHVPDSFGWALRSPGHGYSLVSSRRTLDGAAAAALSASGSYGPILLVDEADRLPTPVLNYFLDYATPGYSASGPTAAVYNHGWIIGDTAAVSLGVQAQLDSLLEVVPQGK